MPQNYTEEIKAAGYREDDLGRIAKRNKEVV